MLQDCVRIVFISVRKVKFCMMTCIHFLRKTADSEDLPWSSHPGPFNKYGIFSTTTLVGGDTFWNKSWMFKMKRGSQTALMVFICIDIWKSVIIKTVDWCDTCVRFWLYCIFYLHWKQNFITSPNGNTIHCCCVLQLDATMKYLRCHSIGVKDWWKNEFLVEICLEKQQAVQIPIT